MARVSLIFGALATIRAHARTRLKRPDFADTLNGSEGVEPIKTREQHRGSERARRPLQALNSGCGRAAAVQSSYEDISRHELNRGTMRENATSSARIVHNPAS